MAKLKGLILAGGAVLALAGSAAAADLLPPPPALEPPPPTAVEFNGWYLRGDVGLAANAATPNLVASPNPLPSGLASGYFTGTPTQSFNNSSISAAANFDLGVGYQVNNWFRFDVTGEYRGGSQFQSLYVINDVGNTGTGTFAGKGPTQLADFYRGSISSLVGLFNGYADLGTWYGITPYVGAGVGLARNTLSGMTDQGVVTIGGVSGPSGGYFSDGSKTNFAWALMAGLDFNVTQNLKLELGYRYLDLGKYGSGGSNCLNGTGVGGGFSASSCGGGVANYVTSKSDLASNDFRLGLRWMIGEEQAYAPPPAPLVRKY
jgi:opacity protein-like surface antigen